MKKFSYSTLALAMLSSYSAIAAQETTSPANDDADIEVIMVSAQKRVERLQDVPIAISVTSSEQLKRDQINSLTDLQRTTPSLELTPTFNGEDSGGGRIRGLGSIVDNETAGASVAIVVDQVPQGNIVLPQLFDLAQVEVLRGPQGTLFGQTASAGVVNITTADPDTLDFYGNVGVDYSNKGLAGSEFGQVITRGTLNIPLSDDTAIRFAAMKKSDSGIQKNMLLDKENKHDSTSFRGKLKSILTDSVTLTVIADYNKSENDGYTFFSMAKTPTNEASLAAYEAEICGVTIKESAQEYCSQRDQGYDRTAYSLSSILQIDFDNIAFTSVSNYRKTHTDTSLKDYTRHAPFPSAVDQQIKDSADQISQELRLQSTSDSNFQYTVGAFYSSYDFNGNPLTDGALGDNSNPIGFSVCNLEGTFCPVSSVFVIKDITIQSKAIFGDATWDIDENMRVFGGLRFTNQSVETGVGINGPVSNTYNSDESNVSGRLGMRYNLSKDAMVYGSYARGFKGQVIDVPPSPALPVTELNPEIPTAYEIGTKVALNRYTNLEANVFLTQVKDFQAQRSVFVGTELVTALENINEIETKGFELAARGSLGDNFSYNAGFIHNTVEYPDGFVGADGGDLSGEQLIFSPKNKFSLSGEYANGLGDNTELFLNTNVVWKSDVRYEARSTDTFVYPSHFTIGASIGMREVDDKWRATLFARNITGEDEPAAYLAGTFLGQIDGGVRAWPVGGVTLRQVGISFDYKF